MPGPSSFCYGEAFDRNLGWLTEWEQQALRCKRVAIAGMGGVGGIHLLTLARLGIGGFAIADFDTFDLANFNRQAGAAVSTLGRPKLDVMATMARDINPELRLRRFPEGVTIGVIDDFLDGADLFVDGFDFFALDIRSRVFARCAELGIPALTAAPIGMGAAWLAFVPGGMSFERYFRLKGHPETEQYLRFLVGLTPKGLHRRYLVDPSRIDLAARTGPSTVAACQLCAGVTAVAALKLLLRRGEVRPAPYHHHFDAYRGRLATSWLPRGNAGPLQRLKLAAGRRMMRRLEALRRAVDTRPFVAADAVDEILHAARWAPSGDNQQPWRFERSGTETVLVHLNRKAAENIYEYRDGEPLLVSGGALLASLEIAASEWRRRMTWNYQGEDAAHHRIAVAFRPDDSVTADRLSGFLPLRSVDRNRYRRRPLAAREKADLERVLDGKLLLDWHESRAARWRIARLSAAATDIRLRAREAFEPLRRAVDWDRRYSPTGIPAAALGLPSPTLRLMRWSMASWARMQLMNRLGGTVSAALQVDYLPALSSSGFFVMRSAEVLHIGDAVAALRAGAAIQRFWLEATRLGLVMQPAIATLIFADYGARGVTFTEDATLQAKAVRLAEAFRADLGVEPQQVVFMGRIGEPRRRAGMARSVRLPLAALWRGSDLV
jgi:molybdopterin/thiamine biosynthesis adenylyltransferase/nitroreductase